ncbi:aminotransferase class V-fold PLP-dependent enzyme [Herbaspirillum seropedicae]|uniref:cysteine desulfurase n=1 Tax=Herbaspirillum seropedicae (strain SmR1) TaxID=757424 RepID=D8IZL5_HERSS|nr:aminotransferase class V-fold PLP-dependent enzyme [Herbaspirillum seropedicae]ADJ64355.1 cysteine desulfurase 2 protein [Herbaspirillum seropedicae SmR1]AKN66291.1 cysteine desulfurase [Herbaspirillum seropedicae]NQE30599.1 cysteine desulfurase [Herbaspirillum seropedicae]UMU22284.1 aminotransferase class V-fold PLP-dependent enzyme [Herbaspirillum seropedicae]
MDTTIYLDNNATTRPTPEVLAAMQACQDEAWGNPSSKHRVGDAARQRMNSARAEVAALLAASAAELVFTSGATEANHMAILGALALQPQRRHIVSSLVEHPSTLLLLRHLQAQGVRISWIAVDEHGQLQLDELAAAITPDTALVSLMWANNETGVVFPIAQAAELARQRGVLFHTDAVQAVGRVPCDVAGLGVDLLSLSAHKLHGPKGIGALYVRKGIKLPPLLFGHQERGRRGGTEDVAGIVGLGVAAAQARAALPRMQAVSALRQRFERGLARLPQVKINGAGAARLPNTVSVRFGQVHAELVLERLDRLGICASSGSACTASGDMPSHVLMAMGMSSEQAVATIRFSLSRDTREDEIDAVLAALLQIVQPLQARAA